MFKLGKVGNSLEYGLVRQQREGKHERVCSKNGPGSCQQMMSAAKGGLANADNGWQRGKGGKVNADNG